MKTQRTKLAYMVCTNKDTFVSSFLLDSNNTRDNE